eukprot:CAMPEP_0198112204 /NCGR_PEP_ID=MMETSP1442-20131203/4087_1 /TAXON_ID= /ORGANISM="Craspedostauros australis, Strain CCMP3328" /LENGTH=319 /DNA_ID=CAMNT_0043768901 /DNA_START=248 /DNA_END=1207 /DNA_ORIENTATION=-
MLTAAWSLASVATNPAMAFQTSLGRAAMATTQQQRHATFLSATASDDGIDEIDLKLMGIAKKLKLDIFDLDEGVFSFASKENRYGLEIVRATMSLKDGGLGLVLTEMAGSPDGRGLVLIREVGGNATNANVPIHVGDAITGVITKNFRGRTTGLNYDRTVGIIGEAKKAAMDDDNQLTLELTRVVERAKILVEIDDGLGNIQRVDALAGEDLRRLLLRKSIRLYDDRTARFDMPHVYGNCGGEGACGTCLVAVQEGQELLNDCDEHETLLLKGRPLTWRASCQTVIGADNKPGVVRISLKPQATLESELNPGVKSLTKN